LPIPLSTHPGQEFDYVLKGHLKVRIGDKVEILNPGDSLYYDSNQPHGMVAVDCEECEFLAIPIQGEAKKAEAPVPVRRSTQIVNPNEKRLCQKYMHETVDDNGHLVSCRFEYPENFNFAYDCVDALAIKSPNKLAMAWVGKDHVRKDFTFFDIALESCRAANYFTSLGIRKGDRVMLVLKRNRLCWLQVVICKALY
jgi:acetyl-CoA synthetase